MIEIRDIEIEDLAPIFHLGERLFTADRWTTLHRTWDEYVPVELFHTDRETCLVATVNGAFAGFALGNLIEKRRSAWTYGYLAWLGVEPEHARHGLGSRMVQQLERRFIDAGARMVLVDTAADNEVARAFFRRHGFGRDEAHVYLAKNLTNEPAYRRRHASPRKD
ncbi:MAG: GNAT family N-acetyltransferase [Myxococcales bacterium]|nr:GNAT family N-acetyltransferase [Myxococcales bacterium]